MQSYHYPIIVERDKEGYYVSCPALQGCYSQGDTYEEAVNNIEDAIRLHIQDRLEHKEELLQPAMVIVSSVDVALR